jgi:hypothetical protein
MASMMTFLSSLSTWLVALMKSLLKPRRSPRSQLHNLIHEEIRKHFFSLYLILTTQTMQVLYLHRKFPIFRQKVVVFLLLIQRGHDFQQQNM